MARLNAADRALVEELGQKIFDWERLAEEHSAVLRTDPNAYAEAWQAYAAKGPQIGTVPTRDNYEEHIRLGEELLQKQCVTIYDHVEAFNTLIYLCRLQLTLVSELKWPVHKAILERITAKHANHQYAPYHAVVPQNPHPLIREYFDGRGANKSAASASASAPPTSEYPIVLPGKSFSWNDILDYPRTPTLPAEVACYKHNPEPLSRLTFMTTGDLGDEAFRVSSFLTVEDEKIFYLVFADEGAEAVSYSSSAFFTLLEASQRVITPDSK